MATRVLIVEDETLISMDIQDMLTTNGFVVSHVATSAAAAEEYLERETPDLALLDIKLGADESSLTVAERLVRSDCRVVFVTGHEKGSIELPEVLRHVPWLSKPFSSEDLMETVNASQ